MPSDYWARLTPAQKNSLEGMLHDSNEAWESLLLDYGHPFGTLGSEKEVADKLDTVDECIVTIALLPFAMVDDIVSALATRIEPMDDLKRAVRIERLLSSPHFHRTLLELVRNYLVKVYSS